jgi:hypothetical protein
MGTSPQPVGFPRTRANTASSDRTCSSSLCPVAHDDSADGPGTHDDEHAQAGEPADSYRDPSTARSSRWNRIPRLDSLVPDQLADRGRTALSHLDTARTSIESARETVRDTTRRLRTPGALFGPPLPAAGVPTAPEHPLHRSQAEVSALLPRGFELPAPQARGTVIPLGWTGDIYLLGADDPQAFVRRLPGKPVSKGKLTWGILEELITDTSTADEDLRVVELLDVDGHVLLRSAPTRRRRPADGWTVREVSLADGIPVAEIAFGHRKARIRHVLPAPTVQALPATTDVQDIDPASTATARVWRDLDELASIRIHDGVRTLAVGPLADDDEALLVWAAVLSWWGGGLV